ncbi:hypothetical protein ACVD6S_14555, partial [Acinetobacter junii]|nr:Uncharacterised protein [Acinetobacter baumannii]
MPKPVKIDEKELEYQEYQRKQAELEQKEWIESMKREREMQAQIDATKQRLAALDKEFEQKPVNRNVDEPKPRPKNDFEI